MKLPHTTGAGFREDSGFVLVGVVVMALALTILGLSLFSLSNYESQFLDRSLAEDQAENRALGEIERAKYRLSRPPYRLESVRSNLPTDGSVVVDAWQPVLPPAGVPDGEQHDGPISWDDSLTITATVTVGNVTRTASGQFDFLKAESYYKRLVTVSGNVVVENDDGQRFRTTSLTETGFDNTPRWQAWQGDRDDSWTALVDNWSGRVKVGGVLPPNVHDFIERDAVAFRPFGIIGDTEGVYALEAAGDSIRYFRHEDPNDGNGPDFSYSSPRHLTFNVSGHIVVMFRNGLHLEKTLDVVAIGPKASLTIVAAWNQLHPVLNAPDATGLWFEGGINSQVPVFLVSDGDVHLEQNLVSGAEDADTEASNLSVFARNLYLRGPKSPHHMWLSYDRTANAVVDSLSEHGALPNTFPGGGRRLALVPGTWQMSVR